MKIDRKTKSAPPKISYKKIKFGDTETHYIRPKFIAKYEKLCAIYYINQLEQNYNLDCWICLINFYKK